MADSADGRIGPDFTFSGYHLDRRQRRLLKDGVAVPLTARAIDTLEALVAHAGTTVSKDDLLRQVWRDTFVQEETLTQNISTIRRALGDRSESPQFVLTVPKEGYRFIAPVRLVPSPSTLEPPIADEARTVPAAHTGVYTTAAVLSVLVVTAASLVWWPRGTPPRDISSPIEFEVFEPEGNTFSTAGGVLSMSPDGRALAFLATGSDGRDMLWLRRMDSLESTPLAGTHGASQPFWSADSRYVAYFSERSLRKIDVRGGTPQTISTLPFPNAVAGTWNQQGLILFSRLGRGIFKVDASGGSAVELSIPGRGRCFECVWPSFLPDGRRFLFAVNSTGAERGIYLGSIDNAPPRRLVEDVSSASYIDAGYLLYAAEGRLVARRFNDSTGEIGRDVIPVADRVWYNPGTRRAVFSASRTGVIAHREPLLSRLQWITRTDEVTSASPEGVYYSFSVARDARVLTSQLDPLRGTFDVWLYGVAWTEARALTLDPASDLRPVWSEDENSVVFVRQMSAGWQLYEGKLDTPGAERALLPDPLTTPLDPVSWNGRVLQYTTSYPSAPNRLWSVEPGGLGTPSMIAEGVAGEGHGVVSPDRKWLAYTTNVTDSRVPNTALLVRPWLNGPARWQVAAAGSLPRWRADGRELFFIAPGGRLMSQPVADGRPVGAPLGLCPTQAVASSGVAGQAYDIATDGQHFLVKTPTRRAAILVSSGWIPRRDQH
jgi:DNA-binding winged helix-turn-helix (wHTH) protein/Tol biopolymer transport system component